MTYKNVFSFGPSELRTAEKIANLGKDYEIFFPIKDEAVDLIVTKNLMRGDRKVITIQVKASRMVVQGVEKGVLRFWIELNPGKLERYSEKVDFYIFVFYKTIYETESVPNFEREYIVVPTTDLIQKSRNKKGWQRGRLNYYFNLYPDGSVLDLRDVNRRNLETEKRKGWRTYTKYRNAFLLLK